MPAFKGEADMPTWALHVRKWPFATYCAAARSWSLSGSKRTSTRRLSSITQVENDPKLQFALRTRGDKLGNQDRKDASQFPTSIRPYVNMIQQKQVWLSGLSGRGNSKYGRREQLHDARRQFGYFDFINLGFEAPSALVELFEALQGCVTPPKWRGAPGLRVARDPKKLW